MEYKEEAYLQLSGLQHFIFCRRQWALIHIEKQWEENVRTIEGRFCMNVHTMPHRESDEEIDHYARYACVFKELGN